jgi:hypothetical protein|tara:strand:+ start:283 stop:1164 length:882 start_codon:yes stop_codon:yes gene_type:complete
MKHDLKDVTFIIPLQIETDDRLRNIILTTSFLLNTFDTNVIIKEVDEEPIFQQWALPVIKRIVGDTSGLNYIFEKHNRNDDAFHRTKVLNDMVLLADTKIVVNYDSDIILPVSSYLEAVEKLKTCDVVYPYRFGERGERKVNLNTQFDNKPAIDTFEQHPEIKAYLESGYNENALEGKYFYYPHQQGEGWAEYGMVQFFNKQVYLDGYLENENFIAYAPEDVERHHRWTLLGYDVQRVDNYAYHFEHKRTPNSWFNNPFMQKNNQLWEYLKNLSKEQVIEYYENQEYVKEKLK